MMNIGYKLLEAALKHIVQHILQVWVYANQIMHVCVCVCVCVCVTNSLFSCFYRVYLSSCMLPSMQCAVTHCNTLQHNETHCNTLQHTATHCNTLTQLHIALERWRIIFCVNRIFLSSCMLPSPQHAAT